MTNLHQKPGELICIDKTQEEFVPLKSGGGGGSRGTGIWEK